MRFLKVAAAVACAVVLDLAGSATSSAAPACLMSGGEFWADPAHPETADQPQGATDITALHVEIPGNCQIHVWPDLAAGVGRGTVAIDYYLQELPSTSASAIATRVVNLTIGAGGATEQVRAGILPRSLNGNEVASGEPMPELAAQPALHATEPLGWTGSLDELQMAANAGETDYRIDVKVRDTTGVGDQVPDLPSGPSAPYWYAIRILVLNTDGWATVAAPAIDGVPSDPSKLAPGATLTCNPNPLSSPIPHPAFAFQWLRDGVPIAGATGPTYVVKEEDRGHALACALAAVDVAGPGGWTSALVNVPLDRTPPRLSGLSLRPKSFVPASRGPTVIAAGRRGTLVSYRLDEPAAVRFRVARRAPHGRYVALKRTFSQSRGTAGRNSLRFSGRLGGRALTPGNYRLIAAPRDLAGNTGRSVIADFTIRR